MALIDERNRKWWAVAAMALTTLLITVDFNGLTVALPTIGRDLAFAYTVSTTGGMAAIPEAKAGAASGMLSMVRLMGAVFGVAANGALFKALENDKLARATHGVGRRPRRFGSRGDPGPALGI